MSDGERQIFVLAADLISFGDHENQIVIVDEPELNLHPSLAERFWNLVEIELPKSVFVYATHSLSFALKDSVETVNLLGYGPIDTKDKSDRNERLAPFLGSFPKIQGAKYCLLVEGQEDSLDTHLYRWMLQRDDFSVLPIGGSTEVSLAAGRVGLWNKLSEQLKIAGVIDRDFKPENITHSNCAKLPFHEAESILAHPEIVLAVQNALGNTMHTSNVEQLTTLIVDHLKETVVQVVIQRAFKRLTINLNVSAERAIIAASDSVERAVEVVQSYAAVEAEKSILIGDPEKVKTVVLDEYQRCAKAIEQRNLNELLILSEGKPLLARMFKLCGCPSPLGLMRAVKKHLNPQDFDFLAGVQEDIRSRLFGRTEP